MIGESNQFRKAVNHLQSSSNFTFLNKQIQDNKIRKEVMNKQELLTDQLRLQENRQAMERMNEHHRIFREQARLQCNQLETSKFY